VIFDRKKRGDDMDWRVFLTTFGLLFVAELGDKTQLAVISLASSEKSPLSVFVGAVLALAMVTLVGVLVGNNLDRWIPKELVHKGAGVLFIILGIFMFFQKAHS
jgi:putative Ca2+/H+ antiporter (TMEM165/GDT1 family)